MTFGVTVMPERRHLPKVCVGEVLPPCPEAGAFAWLQDPERQCVDKAYLGHLMVWWPQREWVNYVDCLMTYDTARRTVLSGFYMTVFGSDPQAADEYEGWIERQMEA